jgi:hypothetical protein
MFLSGNTNISVGSAEAFSLNRDELAGIAETKGDGYYGEKGFWRRVTCSFTSRGVAGSVGAGQKKTMVFEGETAASIQVSGKAIQGQWFLEDVIIVDNDGGALTLKRAELPDANLYFINITA